jgi:hypothetical protein
VLSVLLMKPLWTFFTHHSFCNLVKAYQKVDFVSLLKLLNILVAVKRKHSLGEFATHLGPTKLEGLVSAVACRGYLVYAKKKNYNIVIRLYWSVKYFFEILKRLLPCMEVTVIRLYYMHRLLLLYNFWARKM